MLFLLFAGTVDFGRAYFIYIEATSAAEAGAMYGVQYPTDTAGMRAAALNNAPNLANLTAVATYGSECSDGTNVTPAPAAAPTCTNDVLQYVEVDTTITYNSLLPYPGLQSLFTIHGTSRMRTEF